MPAPVLRELIDPTHTAVLTMEMQRGVIGDLASMGALREEVLAAGAIDGVARVCAAARGVDARVVHCTAEGRADRAGAAANCRILAQSKKRGGNITGSPEAALLPELGLVDSDIVIGRWHGMSPFMSTSLDQVLRNLGITTVIATGVSVNIGLTGMVISAVDLGYQVVIPRGAVAGIPAAYAEAVLENTLAYLATIVSVEEIVDAWTA